MGTKPVKNDNNFRLPTIKERGSETRPKDEANGKIDGDFKQNLPGDCALLASLVSLSKTPEGAQAIEDALCIVRDDDDEIIEYKVTFEGTGETYKITQDELLEAKSPDGSRQYATGDDDVTVLELAFEKCFTESDDPTLRFLVDNYHCSNESDMLFGVNPQSITYLLTGKTIETLLVSAPENGPRGHFTPACDIETTDINGEPVKYESGTMYLNKQTADKTMIISENLSDGTVININYDTYINEVLKENYGSSSNRANELLKNYKENPQSNVLVFGAPKNATVECADGTNCTLTNDEPHAYIIEKVEDDTITLANSSMPNADGARYTVKKDSLLKLDGYWIYGSDNADPKTYEAKDTNTNPQPNDVDIAAAIEKDSAKQYRSIFHLALSKLTAMIGI